MRTAPTHGSPAVTQASSILGSEEVRRRLMATEHQQNVIDLNDALNLEEHALLDYNGIQFLNFDILPERHRTTLHCEMLVMRTEIRSIISRHNRHQQGHRISSNKIASSCKKKQPNAFCHGVQLESETTKFLERELTEGKEVKSQHDVEADAMLDGGAQISLIGAKFVYELIKNRGLDLRKAEFTTARIAEVNGQRLKCFGVITLPISRKGELGFLLYNSVNMEMIEFEKYSRTIRHHLSPHHLMFWDKRSRSHPSAGAEVNRRFAGSRKEAVGGALWTSRLFDGESEGRIGVAQTHFVTSPRVVVGDSSAKQLLDLWPTAQFIGSEEGSVGDVIRAFDCVALSTKVQIVILMVGRDALMRGETAESVMERVGRLIQMCAQNRHVKFFWLPPPFIRDRQVEHDILVEKLREYFEDARGNVRFLATTAPGRSLLEIWRYGNGYNTDHVTANGKMREKGLHMLKAWLRRVPEGEGKSREKKLDEAKTGTSGQSRRHSSRPEQTLFTAEHCRALSAERPGLRLTRIGAPPLIVTSSAPFGCRMPTVERRSAEDIARHRPRTC
uniref:SGNH_hydro domain-containing protein n=1 Tax=Globodera pallida TaxID=36090 RepID=A0A183C364_GLOPA